MPGLDLNLDEASFAAIRGEDEPCATHPQAFLKRLIETIGIARADVVPLGAASGALAARDAFASEVFRPADTTDLWPRWRAAQAPGAVEAALAGVALIEAADEREEALAIAVCLREALEHEGRTAALVTPDRGLAERVRAELLRWNIEIDDSGGAPLAASRAGVMARLILLALTGARRRLGGAAVASGFFARARRRGASVWRACSSSACCASDAAGELLAGPHRPRSGSGARPARASAPEARFPKRTGTRCASVAERLDAAFAPLRALARSRGEARIETLARRASPGARPDRRGRRGGAAGGRDGEALESLFAELEHSANAAFTFHAESYAAFFDALIGERRLARAGARASASEDSRPARSAPDRRRPPRHGGAGRNHLAAARRDRLLPQPRRCARSWACPRRSGASARPPMISRKVSARRSVVLSRAKKRGGSPTTASRFLQRMEALAGDRGFRGSARARRKLARSRALRSTPRRWRRRCSVPRRRRRSSCGRKNCR